MQAALNREVRSTSQDWERAPLSDLIQFLAGEQHSELRTDLLLIRRMIANLASSHGGWRSDRLDPLQTAFDHLEDEFEMHMKNEESILFPAIAAIGDHVTKAEGYCMPAFGSVHNPIRMIEQQHMQTAFYLGTIRDLTRNYTLRDPDCEMFHMLCQALERLDASMQAHILLEQQVLFPLAMRLEARLSRSS